MIIQGSSKNRQAEYDFGNQGRFPANLLVSDDLLNDGRIIRGSHSQIRLTHNRNKNVYGDGLVNQPIGTELQGINDSGSFSRYFDLDKWWAKTFPFLIVPKASKSEKDKGCEGLPTKEHWATDNRFTSDPRMTHEQNRIPNKNNHPTVKPLKLMSYLITLGSREGDTILDPFVGSGTTAVACKMLKRDCIGIDISKNTVR